MRWTRAEQRAFFEQWGEEDPPTGWRALREWLADRWGQDRALRHWRRVVVGGDATLATLALRAHSRLDPDTPALWVPDPHWAHVPFVWVDDPQEAERLSHSLGRTGRDMGVLLAQVRRAAHARLETGGGAWERSERRLFDRAVDGKRVCVLKPRGPLPPPPVPGTDHEANTAAFWAAAVDAAPLWGGAGAAMVGGVAQEVWVLSGDPARMSWKNEPNVRDFSLAVSPQTPISEARSQWWDAAQALIAAANTASVQQRRLRGFGE